MTRIVYNGMVMVAMECFRGGFVDLHGKLVMDEYKVRGPVFCSSCGLREATLFRTLERGPFKLCNRLVCGPCSQKELKPVCLCGKEATRTVVLEVYRKSEVLTFQDQLCNKCKFTTEHSLIQRWVVPAWRKGFQPESGEEYREIKHVNGKLTVEVMERSTGRTIRKM